MWADDVAAALHTPGGGAPCLLGHDSHGTLRLTVDTSGPAPIPDWPADPENLAHRWEMVVFDRDRYADDEGCIARDPISHTLVEHGKWEAWESLVVTAVLAGSSGWVVDLGCQLGWYTLLAADAGLPVVAADANPETLGLLARNCELNGYADQVTPVLAFVDEGTPQAPRGERVRFLKVDIEGLEVEAVRVFAPSLAAGDVDFALLELSPMFNDSWRDAHQAMVEAGMVAFQIPNKGDDPVEFAADPLGVTLGRPFDPAVPFDQLNIFYARKDLL